MFQTKDHQDSLAGPEAGLAETGCKRPKPHPRSPEPARRPPRETSAGPASRGRSSAVENGSVRGIVISSLVGGRCEHRHRQGPGQKTQRNQAHSGPVRLE